ncbi:MAG: hypothetical protein KAR19_20190 [Bacteroidales bacterium]|nr:hypothetical protein [Bacteroidales bacterium]
MKSNQFSRRKFVKTGIISSAALTGAVSLTSCNDSTQEIKNQLFPYFKGEDWNPTDGVAGLLFSQIGYELGLPVRVVVGLPQKKCLSGNTRCGATATATIIEEAIKRFEN